MASDTLKRGPYKTSGKYVQKDPPVFDTTEEGCIVPVNRKLNQDGYYRVNRKRHGRAYMHHRLVWEAANGPIPDGYEIHHRCGNRACQNINHLEIIEGSAHATLTNLERDFCIGKWKKVH